jgi:hypothetical protein
VKKLKMAALKLVVVSGIIILSGCGANQANSADPAENQKSKEQLLVNDKSGESDTPADGEPATISLNQPLTIPDFAEITLKKVSFTTKVTPPNPGSFYTYYEVKDSANIFYDIVVDIKNLLPTGKMSNEFIAVKVKYDGKYEYGSFSTIEEGGGSDFTYTNITSIEPLKSGTIHFIAELPVDVSKDQKPLEVIVASNGEDYVYKAR